MKNLGMYWSGLGGGSASRAIKSLALAAIVAGSALSAPAQAAPAPGALETDGNLVSESFPDWASLFTVPAPRAEPVTNTTTAPAGYSSAKFKRDFIDGSSADNTTYATGSKDTLNIAAGWECGSSNNVNAKVDLLNTYATIYTNASGQQILYFGLETASNEGTRDVGFWFLKDGTVGCTASGGKNSKFTGNHVDGDLLIVAEYTGGGSVSFVKVYKWVGGVNGGLVDGVVGKECLNSQDPADICGSSNKSALTGTAVPWLTQTKTSNPSIPNLKSTDLDRGMFFEGKLNLTSQNLSSCFGKFVANTRSSATPNATLFDFAVGDFASCSIGVAKTCKVISVATDAQRAQTGKSFVASFTGAVTNTGGASIPTGTIISVLDDAGTPAPTVNDDVALSYTLQAPLLPNGQLPFSGTFFTNQNPPMNTVSASTVVGGTTLLAKAYSIECDPLTLTSMLTVEKNCGIPAALNGGVAKPGTELVVSGGMLVVKVNVSGQICNNSPVDGSYPYLTVNAGEQEGVNPSTSMLGDPIGGFPANLAPQACKTYAFSYTPKAADGLTSPASTAMFTDTVSAVGSHPAMPIADQPKATGNAHCPLCTCTGPGCTVP